MKWPFKNWSDVKGHWPWRLSLLPDVHDATTPLKKTQERSLSAKPSA